MTPIKKVLAAAAAAVVLAVAAVIVISLASDDDDEPSTQEAGAPVDDGDAGDASTGREGDQSLSEEELQEIFQAPNPIKRAKARGVPIIRVGPGEGKKVQRLLEGGGD